jgi:hypothetical protein
MQTNLIPFALVGLESEIQQTRQRLETLTAQHAQLQARQNGHSQPRKGRTYTAAQRKAISRRMKAAWKARKARQRVLG